MAMKGYSLLKCPLDDAEIRGRAFRPDTMAGSATRLRLCNAANPENKHGILPIPSPLGLDEMSLDSAELGYTLDAITKNTHRSTMSKWKRSSTTTSGRYLHGSYC